ncbi:hypothetical protein TL16_g12310 [Triparma laevis f. inornata]|uniref:FAD dependent oxidoreductase domain-containing protein n=2 Tax=Triparma laevis TaxID=1534972 RepID=A0A9W7E4W8_9STRA|nr:hypothetical protein TrLO_g4002 [Triparma laevis f. longispina]GMH92318.1 hypothetical protein TL16_g12310 [Triparma laevis f. inornata]
MKDATPNHDSATDTTTLTQTSKAGYLNPNKLIEAQTKIFTANGGNVINESCSKITTHHQGSNSYSLTLTNNQTINCDQIIIACGWNTCGLTLNDSPIGNFNNLFSRYLFKTQSCALFEVEPSQLPTLPTSTIVFGGPTKGTEQELALHSCYMVPPILYLSSNKLYVKIGHGKYLEEVIPSDKFDEVAHWYNNSSTDPTTNTKTTTIDCLAQILKSLYPSFTQSNKTLTRNGVTVDTADSRVIQEKINDEKIYVCFGCNGYGAKCSDEVGRRMATMIQIK